MPDDDNLGFAAATSIAIVLPIFLGPIILGFTLLKMFFRTPLAALIGAIVTTILSLIGYKVFINVTVDMNPLAQIGVMVIAGFVGSGICIGLSKVTQELFDMECAIIHTLLTRMGATGRALYLLIQFIPLAAILVLATLMAVNFDQVQKELFHSDGSAAFNLFAWIGIYCWLSLSQFVVLKWHRTGHPVASEFSFWGHPIDNEANDFAIVD